MTIEQIVLHVFVVVDISKISRGQCKSEQRDDTNKGRRIREEKIS